MRKKTVLGFSHTLSGCVICINTVPPFKAERRTRHSCNSDWKARHVRRNSQQNQKYHNRDRRTSKEGHGSYNHYLRRWKKQRLFAQHVVNAVRHKRIEQTTRKDMYNATVQNSCEKSRARSQLEIVLRMLRAPAYGSSPDQVPYGKAIENWTKSVTKRITDKLCPWKDHVHRARLDAEGRTKIRRSVGRRRRDVRQSKRSPAQSLKSDRKTC